MLNELQIKQYKFYIAVKAMIFHDGKFLLIKRSGAARGDSGYWEFPGGRLEFGESPEAALHREVQEEAGLNVSIIRPLTAWSFLRDESTQITGITFLCEADTWAVVLGQEHNGYAWITYNEMNKYNIIPSLLDDLKKIDILEFEK